MDTTEEDRYLEHKEQYNENQPIPEIDLNTPLFLPASRRDMKVFPSPYECAVLSHHAYREDVQAGDSVEIMVGITPYKLSEWRVYERISSEKEDWLDVIAKKMLGLTNGYRGTLYKHRYKKQMVLAHQGTKPHNMFKS